MTDPIVVSAAPEELTRAATLGDGIEAKLDWEHHETLSGDHTLSRACVNQSVDPESITSVHLPPGTDRPRGLSVAPGNVGDILDFVHGAFGDNVRPQWLTVHTTRSFDYRDQVDRLATITERGGYPLSVENTPDTSYYYSPEDIAALAFLTTEVPRLTDVSVLIDTTHVQTDRRELAVHDESLASVLERFDDQLRDRISESFREFVEANLNRIERGSRIDAPPPSAESPWRPVFVTLGIVGGSAVSAIHLNDPGSTASPRGNVPKSGFAGYCRSVTSSISTSYWNLVTPVECRSRRRSQDCVKVSDHEITTEASEN